MSAPSSSSGVRPAQARATDAVAASPVEAAPHWVAPLFCLLALALVPWTALLAETLPGRAVSRHWDVAWVGFDVALLISLALTGWCAWRRTPWLVSAATAAATLLICDAWFDVTTARAGAEFFTALGEALLIELPLAALALWTAGHAERVFERVWRTQEWRAGRQAGARTAGD